MDAEDSALTVVGTIMASASAAAPFLGIMSGGGSMAALGVDQETGEVYGDDDSVMSCVDAILDTVPLGPDVKWTGAGLASALDRRRAPSWIRAMIRAQVAAPCCVEKKCVLNCFHYHADGLLDLMLAAKDHSNLRGSHRRQSTVDMRTKFAPRPAMKSGGMSAATNMRGVAATTLSSREKQKQRIFRALSTKNVVKDALAQRRSTVDRRRVAFLEEHVERLINEGHFCIQSIYLILSCTRNDLYAESYGEAALLDRVGGRQRRLRGSRKERKLPELNSGPSSGTFSDTTTNDCCQRGCSQQGKASNIQLWEHYEANVKSLRHEIDFFMNYLWDQSMGRLSSVCLTHVHNLFGISPGMFYTCCSELEARAGARAARRHGNEGRRPANATSLDTVRRFYEVIERHVMWDPTSPLAFFTGSGTATTGLLKMFQDDLSKALYDQCSKTTQLSLIQRWVDDKDLLGIKARANEHNYCVDDKKYFDMMLRCDLEEKRAIEREAGGGGGGGGGGGSSLKSAAEWAAEKKAAKDALEAHRLLHFELFVLRQKLKALAIAMLARATTNGFRAWKHNKVREWDLLRILVVDDKAAAVYPSVVQAASSDLYRYTSGLNGQADSVYEEMTAYVTDSTKSQKHTDSVIFEILMELLERNLGEKYLVLV